MTEDQPRVATAVQTRVGPDAPPPPAPPADMPAELAGRYRVHADLARGGMGVVYRATDAAFGREVAVKTVQPQFAGRPAVLGRFVTESRITGRLQHPAIPPVYDSGSLPDGRPFLAMKLVRGDTLEALLKQRPDPTADLGRFEAVAQAVGYAHAKGVIHRDLKPANVMVGAFGEVQVMDWGLAKVLADRAEPEATTDAGESRMADPRDSDADATRAGSLLGSPAYMAPEQALGTVEQIDRRTDVFGLGAVLAVVLTGHPPWAGLSVESIRAQALRGDLGECHRRLDDCRAEPELVALCRRCLAADRDDRPADANAVADEVAALRAAADDRARRAELEVAERRVRDIERRQRRRLLVTAAALVLVVSLVGAGGSLAFGLKANQSARVANTERGRADVEAAVAREQSSRAEKQKSEAEAEAKRANEVTSVLQGMFESTDPFNIFTEGLVSLEWEKQRRKTAVEVLREMVPQVQERLRDQPLGRARLLSAMGSSFRNAGLFKDAEPLVVGAQELRRQHLPADSVERAVGEQEVGRLRLDQGDYMAALAAFRRAVEVFQNAPDQQRRWITARLFEGWALGMLGRPEATKVLSAVVADNERLYGATHPQTVLAMIGLAAVDIDLDRVGEAMELLKRILAGIDAQPDGQLKTLAKLVSQYQATLIQAKLMSELPVTRPAGLRLAEHNLRELEQRVVKAMPATSVYLAVVRYELALAVGLSGRHDECERLLLGVLDDVRQTVGLAHPKTLIPVKTFIEVVTIKKRPDDARRLLAEVEQAMTDRYGLGSVWHIHVRLERVYAECLADDYRAATDLTRQVLADGADKLVITRESSERVLRAAQQLQFASDPDSKAAAVDLFRLARRLASEVKGPDTLPVFLSLRDEATALVALGRLPEARPMFIQATTMAVRLGAKLTAEERGKLALHRARLDARVGEWAAAETGFREALRAAWGYTAADRDRVEWGWDLAALLADRGRPGEAANVIDQSRPADAAIALPTTWADRATVGTELIVQSGTRTAACRLRAGDRDGYLAALADLRKRFHGSNDPEVLSPIARAVSLSPTQTVWNPRELADALAKSRPGKLSNTAGMMLDIRLGGPGPA